MKNIEIDLFMLYHVWLPLFGLAISGAMAIGFIIGIKSERKFERERREWDKMFASLEDDEETDKEGDK